MSEHKAGGGVVCVCVYVCVLMCIHAFVCIVKADVLALINFCMAHTCVCLCVCQALDRDWLSLCVRAV